MRWAEFVRKAKGILADTLAKLAHREADLPVARYGKTPVRE